MKKDEQKIRKIGKFLGCNEGELVFSMAPLLQEVESRGYDRGYEVGWNDYISMINDDEDYS